MKKRWRARAEDTSHGFPVQNRIVEPQPGGYGTFIRTKHALSNDIPMRSEKSVRNFSGSGRPDIYVKSPFRECLHGGILGFFIGIHSVCGGGGVTRS